LGLSRAELKALAEWIQLRLQPKPQMAPPPENSARAARVARRKAADAANEGCEAAGAPSAAPARAPAPVAGADAAEPAPQLKVKPPKAPPKESAREQREAQATFEFAPPQTVGGFTLPELSMLAKPKPRAAAFDEGALRQNAQLLENVLAEFGVRGQVDQIRPGPVVTLYELAPAAGVKSARVVALADDIARSMSVAACRVSVVQGRNAIGIELPNQKRETVYLRDLLNSPEYERGSQVLPMALGETIGGESYIADLAKMPHLLIAGTTGSGKSVGVNAMILSILYRLPPEQCRMIMIDPKMLELSVYDGIPHLLAPVVTDPKKAIVALKWAVREMEDRYRRMSKIGVRNIASYNERAKEAAEKGEHFERTVQTGFDEGGRPIYESEKIKPEPMPYLVVIIDEVADLMMVAGKDIEGAVQRLAQMARAAGIHVIMATQRPSVDVITGTIKANFPTRISFQVTSKIDSRTILGEQGAEQLLGQGDMLYMAGGGRVTRLHGPFVSDGEVEAVAKFLREQGQPQYLEEVTAGGDEDGEPGDLGLGGDGEGNDLYDRAVAIVTRDGKASTSYIQRRLQIGYNRAASLIERMEQEGVVGPANHAGKREILVSAAP
ncbi:MAG TPA: DNA translocase FtsK, partial [Phenylobacterium sp.]|uniref:DNA translocase FtsK n=1 Tax=Phenylobacterium sp. TaxID=1871053 RepID=UPI002B46A547